MAERRRVVVVGGGVGGLACAIRLRVAGHPVTVFERNDVVGGKLATRQRDGFTFDVGPSLVTLPHLFDDVFALAGTSLAEHVTVVRLDPQFRYHWADGAHLVVADDRDATIAAFEELAAGAGAAWARFDAHGQQIWEVAERTFFAGPMGNPVELVRRMRSPRDLWSIDPLRSLHRAARDHFAEPRLHQWAGRYATYSGSSPFRAPATLSCIPHIESRFGCWYPIGSLGTLRSALEVVATDVGVEIVTRCDVTALLRRGTRVHAVRLADGSTVEAEVVVANVDAEHLYRDLLPDRRALSRVRRAGRSTSGFVVCVGVRGATPGIGHHNVWFSPDDRAEFDAIDAGRLIDEPTVYACVSSVTDPTQAPDGCENWFLLVNTPVGADLDVERSTAVVFDRLASFGIDLRSRASFVETMTPTDIDQRYRAPGGAIYGTSSNGPRAAFVRPANRGPLGGLYLVGGSSHPGGGLPLVTMSARIVADLIAEDVDG